MPSNRKVCFTKLNDFVEYWNSHSICVSCIAECPPGIPDDLYAMPEEFGMWLNFAWVTFATKQKAYPVAFMSHVIQHYVDNYYDTSRRFKNLVSGSAKKIGLVAVTTPLSLHCNLPIL